LLRFVRQGGGFEFSSRAEFLGHFTPGSRIKEAVTLLLNARELEFTRIGDRSLIQMPAEVVKPRESIARDATNR